MSAPIADQPPPMANERPAIWDLVIADMRDRDRIGRERYGTPLQPGNGRDPLVDAYQEALDLAVYLRQAIEERSDATAYRAGMVAGRAEMLRRVAEIMVVEANEPAGSRWEKVQKDYAEALLAAFREAAGELDERAALDAREGRG